MNLSSERGCPHPRVHGVERATRMWASALRSVGGAWPHARPMLEVEAFHEPTKCSARSWSAAVLCRFRQRVAFAKRQRTAALQDADALAAAPVRFMAPMRVRSWR